MSILKSLSCPGIVRVHEQFEDEENVYFVQDFIDGVTLKNFIRTNGQLSEMHIALVVFKLLKLLKYLEEHHVLHRDIKPDNIMVKGPTQDVCLIDFGLAVIEQKSCQYKFKKCGTPGYIAPEILRDMNYDYKVDVFSCGAVMYFLVNKKNPFTAKSENEIVKNNYFCKMEFKNEAQISEAGMNFLKSLLTENPIDRPSASQALENDWFKLQFGEQLLHQLRDECIPRQAMQASVPSQSLQPQLADFRMQMQQQCAHLIAQPMFLQYPFQQYYFQPSPYSFHQVFLSNPTSAYYIQKIQELYRLTSGSDMLLQANIGSEFRQIGNDVGQCESSVKNSSRRELTEEIQFRKSKLVKLE